MFLKSLFSDDFFINLQNRSPEQVRSILRRIWVKTLVNHWPIERIEMELNIESGKQFNLIKEFKAMTKLSSCPRDIKNEFKNYYRK